MKKAVAKKTTDFESKAPYTPSAQVIDGTLILSLPDAISPVVWQMELGKTKASAIEVREEGKAHKLILKTPQADVYHIADYADREKATDALLTVSSAMRMAQGHLRPEQAKTALIPHPQNGQKSSHSGTAAFLKRHSAFGWLWTSIKWVVSLIVLLIGLFLLINVVKFYVFTYATTPDQAAVEKMSQQQTPQVTPQKGVSETVGKPVSGDDFLRELQGE